MSLDLKSRHLQLMRLPMPRSARCGWQHYSVAAVPAHARIPLRGAAGWFDFEAVWHCLIDQEIATLMEILHSNPISSLANFGSPLRDRARQLLVKPLSPVRAESSFFLAHDSESKARHQDRGFHFSAAVTVAHKGEEEGRRIRQARIFSELLFWASFLSFCPALR